MEARTVNNLPPAGAHDDAVRCLLAIELSRKIWIVAVNTPLSDKISRHTLKPCDRKELLDLCDRIRTRVARETKKRGYRFLLRSWLRWVLAPPPARSTRHPQLRDRPG